jgi:hypothetical protein
MNNPEFEPDILKSIDKSGYSEKQTDLQMDKKGTVRQQIKQANTQGQNPSTPQKSGVLLKKEKKAEVIFER